MSEELVLYRIERVNVVTREMALDAGQPEREGEVVEELVPDPQATAIVAAVQWPDIVCEGLGLTSAEIWRSAARALDGHTDFRGLVHRCHAIADALEKEEENVSSM